GNVIVISHEDGTSTLYAHASKLLVTKGAVVVQNQVIARVGSTGMSTGNHLHFTVYEGGNTANPSEYLSDGFLKALNKRGFNLKSESAE
ncbi:MAG: M23 family metallopeptidase, partial [Clostridia bacterium]